MARLIGVLFVAASFLFLTAAPASAGPYMSWGQWTSDPGVPFSQCWDRGARAFAAVGLSSSQDGRFFHGSDDVFTVSLVCYDLGNRFIVTITVAAERSGRSPMTTDQVRDRMVAVIFGSGTTAGNCPSSPVGTWNWWNGGTATFYANGTANSNGYSGNWERLNDGSYHVHWSYPSDDYFRISADGRSMPGNYNGTAGTSTRQGSC